MQAIGINAFRAYNVPPTWLLETASAQRLAVFVDVPWSSHLCFLRSSRHRAEARDRVRQAAERGRQHACLLAYSVGNEIPANIVRWHGHARIERFLAELGDVAKQVDPDGLVTYANFPPTEYLDLSFVDFVMFNVYLHDLEAYRRYLFRLQNLVGAKPLVLGELGMDTLRHGEREQAAFLKSHVREAILMGLGGVFAFSWTDDWYTGGCPITNWAFGITDAERRPKASYHALREVFESSLAGLLQDKPRVSVVVCSYNGGRTLDQCLRSLLALDYPNYEVIVVDDGSTDNTRAILQRYPTFRAIHQPNQGLSTARNVGLQAATGSIIAYTDADCFADANWLAQLVHQFERCDAAAVGGPSFSPGDGCVAACVAASPGQPTYVLENDQVAEHIPGCNMAFRRQALEAIHGFDPQFRKAGDDVDICWRLQQAGAWITLAPGAFVWHHCRQTARAYLRQQGGYGEAEALLRFKHPDKFNFRGDGKWQGVLYGPSLKGLHLQGPIIYRGTFGTGLFQCLYRAQPAHWAMLPGTLEWHLLAGLAALAALRWPMVWLGVGAMLGLSLAVGALQAAQARLASRYDCLRARLLILALCYAQPLVRSWSRYRTRFLSYTPPAGPPPAVISKHAKHGPRLSFAGTRTVAYWSEQGQERTALLGRVIAYLNAQRWGKTVDSGWQDWDLEIHCHPWTVVQVRTAQEEHGRNKRLIRVRSTLRISSYAKVLGGLHVLAAGAAYPFEPWLTAVLGTLFLVGMIDAWWEGVSRLAQVLAILDSLAGELAMVPVPDSPPRPPRIPSISSVFSVSSVVSFFTHGQAERGNNRAE
jgi:GT2 family glycosyltransferase